MNVAMFTNTYLPHVGGVARSVNTFASDLRKLGYNVLIVSPTFPGAEDSSSHVLRVPALQNFNGSDFSVRIPIPNIIDARIDDFEPDLIHSHHPFLLGDAALRTARERKLPIIYTQHTLYEQYIHYVPIHSDKLRRFVIQLCTEYANLCDHVVVPSQSVMRLLEKRGVEIKMTEIPTGIDLQFFGQADGSLIRKELNLTDDVFLLGHLGRLAPEKNLDYLVDAIIPCLRKHKQAHVLIVGDGSSKNHLQEEFRLAGVADKVHMPGKKTGQDLANAYAAMDLFLFSSKSETQGLVLAEAMAAGCPVVALDASGVREVLRNGINGRLLPTETSQEEFAAVLHDLITHPEQLEEYRNGAHETVKVFSRENSARRMADTYEQLVSNFVQNGRSRKISVFDSLLASIRVEWDLFGEKSTALVSAVTDNSETEGTLE